MRLLPQYEHTAGDSRLLYGMGGPLLAACALIIGVFVIGEVWLIPLLMLVILGLTAMVLFGIAHMLDEDGDEKQ